MLEFPDDQNQLDHLYRTLFRMQKTQEWEFFSAWLTDNMSRMIHEAAKERDEINLRWRQGALQMVEALINAFAEAEDAATGVLYRLPTDESRSGVM